MSQVPTYGEGSVAEAVEHVAKKRQPRTFNRRERRMLDSEKWKAKQRPAHSVPHDLRRKRKDLRRKRRIAEQSKRRNRR